VLHGDRVRVGATEVDDALGALVACADVVPGDAPGAVAATGLAQRTDQRLLRRRASDLDEVGDGAAASIGSGRLVLTDTHWFFLVLSVSPGRRRCRSCPRGG